MLLGNLKGPKGDKGDRGLDSMVPGPASTIPGPASTEPGPVGPMGPIQTQNVVFHHPLMAASAVATNLAANVVNAVSDPNLRQFVDLRGLTKCRIHGRLGGTVNVATRIRLQYHGGVNIAVATGDAGWQTLADTAGGHAANTMFRSAEFSMPVAAQIQNCIVRAVIFSGDGTADPTLTCVIADFTP